MQPAAEDGRGRRAPAEDAGCKFAPDHPKRLTNIGVLNDRDHRKLAVIDGRVAFVGGHCIVDSWLGNAQDSEHYARSHRADSQVRS